MGESAACAVPYLSVVTTQHQLFTAVWEMLINNVWDASGNSGSDFGFCSADAAALLAWAKNHLWSVWNHFRVALFKR